MSCYLPAPPQPRHRHFSTHGRRPAHNTLRPDVTRRHPPMARSRATRSTPTGPSTPCAIPHTWIPSHRPPRRCPNRLFLYFGAPGPAMPENTPGGCVRRPNHLPRRTQRLRHRRLETWLRNTRRLHRHTYPRFSIHQDSTFGKTRSSPLSFHSTSGPANYPLTISSPATGSLTSSNWKPYHSHLILSPAKRRRHLRQDPHRNVPPKKGVTVTRFNQVTEPIPDMHGPVRKFPRSGLPAARQR